MLVKVGGEVSMKKFFKVSDIVFIIVGASAIIFGGIAMTLGGDSEEIERAKFVFVLGMLLMVVSLIMFKLLDAYEKRVERLIKGQNNVKSKSNSTSESNQAQVIDLVNEKIDGKPVTRDVLENAVFSVGKDPRLLNSLPQPMISDLQKSRKNFANDEDKKDSNN